MLHLLAEKIWRWIRGSPGIILMVKIWLTPRGRLTTNFDIDAVFRWICFLYRVVKYIYFKSNEAHDFFCNSENADFFNQGIQPRNF